MLPALAKMFALVRDLSARREVTEIPASRWLLQRHGLGPLTALAGASPVRDELARSTVRWVALSSEITALVEQFADAEIGIAPIKGFAYARHLYAIPAARPMTDVDLLVEPGAEKRARRLLARQGFELRADATMHHASMWERGDLVVDLHRDMLPRGRGAIALDEVWSRTRPTDLRGARRLEAVDELTFHMIHMVRNRLCGPLVQVVDAARLLEHASPEDVHRRAVEWRLETGTDLALAFCKAVLAEEPVPWIAAREDDVLMARQPSPLRKAIFDIATAGSIQQLGARLFNAGAQRLTLRRARGH